MYNSRKNKWMRRSKEGSSSDLLTHQSSKGAELLDPVSEEPEQEIQKGAQAGVEREVRTLNGGS